MKFNKFKTVIFIGFLAIVGVIIMQLFLLNQAYIFEKRDTEDKIYGNYISIDGKPSKMCADCFSKNTDLTYYFAIRFPNLKQSYFTSLSQYWVFTGVLFLVLIIYVYSVFLMLQQKRYTELQNDFINNMTHEFKTPLASILIASNYANSQNEIKENPKLFKYIQIIINQSNKLNQHIEKILYVAKTDSNQIVLEKTKVDNTTVLELVKENIQLKHQKEIQVALFIDKKYHIHADEFHFYNLIYNVIDNAVKYSENEPKIQIKGYESSKGLTLEFTDHGMGIPEKDLPFVFDKFYRVARQDNKDIEGF